MGENKEKIEKKAEGPKGTKKLSYEELEITARQLSAQFDAVLKENINLKQALQQAQTANLFAQLEFMFKVVENANAFDTEFVQKCTDAIQRIMLNTSEEKKKESDNEQK